MQGNYFCSSCKNNAALVESLVKAVQEVVVVAQSINIVMFIHIHLIFCICFLICRLAGGPPDLRCCLLHQKLQVVIYTKCTQCVFEPLYIKLFKNTQDKEIMAYGYSQWGDVCDWQKKNNQS